MAYTQRDLDKRAVEWLKADIEFEREQITYWKQRLSSFKQKGYSDETISLVKELLKMSEDRLATLKNTLNEKKGQISNV